MIDPFSQARTLRAVVLLLVFDSLVLAAIDPSTRSMFGDLTKVVVGAYIGLHIPAPNQIGKAIGGKSLAIGGKVSI